MNTSDFYYFNLFIPSGRLQGCFVKVSISNVTPIQFVIAASKTFVSFFSNRIILVRVTVDLVPILGIRHEMGIQPRMGADPSQTIVDCYWESDQI